MRENPGLDERAIARCLGSHYGIEVATVEYLPLGYDLRAAVYRVVASDGESHFAKVRFDTRDDTGLLVARALAELWINNILAPAATIDGQVSAPLDGHRGYSVLVYRFIRGESAMFIGLTDDQWREFGATLRAVHSSGLEQRFREQLTVEAFSLPSGDLVRRLLTLTETAQFTDPTATRFAEFWRANDERIRKVLDQAEELGRNLQAKSFEHVLCHADIHAANILVSDDGQIWLVDWDGPKIAPRERDLLFVVGSRIARTVEPREEDLFFEAYGPVEIDPEALVYYRYERIIEDLGELGRSVFEDPAAGDSEREEAAELAMSFFAPEGDVDHAERVTRYRWPSART